MPLGLNSLEVAYGITQVANSAMTRVLRAVSTERGRDPREFTLLAFGGAGPIHAAALAENMGISRVIVPLFPGLFSALGLLLADYRHDYIAAIAAPVTSVRAEEIMARYEQLKGRARAEMVAEGVDPNAIRFDQQVDLKYGYQMYEMTLPFPAEVDSSNVAAALCQLFTDAHNQAYGYYRDDPIQLVSIRLRALASAGSLSFAELARRYSKNGAISLRFPQGQHGSIQSERPVFFGPVHGIVTTGLRNRFSLNGTEQGPIIIEEPDTTVVIPPGWTVGCDRFGNLVVTKI